MALYRGRRTEAGVTVFRDGKPFTAARSLAVWAHSATGFEWGYQGSGPAQLALALLLDVTGEEEALAWHQRFKSAVIAVLAKDSWAMTGQGVLAWLRHAQCCPQ